jgi:hypothetical protein
MKKKILFASILLIANSSILAATGHGYRVIKEEIHSSPGIQLHVEEVGPGTTAAMQKKSLASGITTTVIPNRVIKLGQIGQLDGYHHIAVINTSSVQKETYEYKISIACTTATGYFSRFIEVDPGGSYSTDEHSYVAIQGGVIGNYPILGATSVTSGYFAQASNGTGILYVTK